MDIRKLSQNIQEETEKIIVGKSDRIRLIVMSILANGHILLDDLPGVGKTTLVKTISCLAISSVCGYTIKKPGILSCARGR